MRRAVGCLVLLLLAGPAVADKASKAPKAPKAPPTDPGDVDAPPERPATPAKAPHREGDYGGVIPGQRPEGKQKRPSKGTLSWIGFEAKDGGAQVFFQSPASFEVNQHVEGATLVVHLMLQRLGANTWRQVDTRYFDNPLSGIVAKAVRAGRATKTSPARAAGIEVRITFKNPKDAREGSLSTKTEPDGMSYAYLSFPPGTAVEGAPATNAAKGGDVDR